MAVKGIDISEWQGNLSSNNWNQIKNDGIKFAMIRCGYTAYGPSKNKRVDKYFENNYTQCKKVGMSVGTYYYSCATTVAEGIAEANFVLNLIKDKQFEYPIVIDTEDNHDTSNANNAPTSQASIGKNQLTPIIKAFCETIEKAGYYVSIYASTSWFKNNLILNDLVDYDKWVAQWSNTAPTAFKYGMWQYSSKGSVSGIGGYTDLDEAYKDFPGIMKQFGLNNFPKDEPTPDPTPEPEPEPIPDPEPTPNPEPCNILETIVNLFKNIWKFIKNLFKRGD